MPGAMSQTKACCLCYEMDFEMSTQHGFCCYNLTSQYGELGCALSLPYEIFTVFLSINVGNKNHIGVVYIHISTVPI